MNTNQFIGLPVEVVTKKLEEEGISYKIKESSNIQKKYDTILVVNAVKKEDYVELTTDKFLLYI